MTGNEKIKNPKHRPLHFVLIILLVVISDQAIKILVKGFNLFGISHEGFKYGEVRQFLGEFLQWTYIENFGMAFGIKLGIAKTVVSVLTLLFPFFLFYYLVKIYRRTRFIVLLGLSLVIGGAIGNGIDRCFSGVFYGTGPLFQGGVVDFILVDIPDIDFWGLSYSHFPVFNIADSCITVGVALLLIFNKYLLDINKPLIPPSSLEE